jgi:hypothetical protein
LYAWIHVKGSLVTLMDPGVKGWNIIVQHPLTSTYVGRTFLTGKVREAFQRLRQAPLESVLLAFLFSLWPLLATAAAGVAIVVFRHEPGIRALAVFIVLWLLIVGGAFAECRHRSPVVPALSALAAIGLAELTGSLGHRRRLPIASRPATCSRIRSPQFCGTPVDSANLQK